MGQSQQMTRYWNNNRYSDTAWFWQVLVITAFISLSLAAEGLACHTVSLSPKGLTYNAELGKANPPNQTIAVSSTRTSQTTLTDSDDASWLSESPASTSMTTSAKLTAAVNTSGLKSAGTYNATIAIKVGSWCTYKVPVTLVISPSTTSTTPPPPSTSSATLTWNAVTSTPVNGYDVYVGTAPGSYSTKITLGNVTSYTVNSLNVGTTYYFVVSAYNSAGEGPTSAWVSKTIQSP